MTVWVFCDYTRSVFKRFVGLPLVISLLLFLAFPALTVKAADPSSFELFWPVVAGKTVGDRFYSLKLFKEKTREVLIPSSLKKAEYNILLSEKRLVEAEKLLMIDENLKGAKETLEMAKIKRHKVFDLLQLAKKAELPGHSDVSSRFVGSLERQLTLVSIMEGKLSGDEKALVLPVAEDIKSLLSGL